MKCAGIQPPMGQRIIKALKDVCNCFLVQGAATSNLYIYTEELAYINEEDVCVPFIRIFIRNTETGEVTIVDTDRVTGETIDITGLHVQLICNLGGGDL